MDLTLSWDISPVKASGVNSFYPIDKSDSFGGSTPNVLGVHPRARVSECPDTQASRGSRPHGEVRDDVEAGAIGEIFGDVMAEREHGLDAGEGGGGERGLIASGAGVDDRERRRRQANALGLVGDDVFERARPTRAGEGGAGASE
jgi:hypothetical protein